MSKSRHSSAAHRGRTAQMRYYTRYRVASVAKTSSDSSQSTVDPSPAAITRRRPYSTRQLDSTTHLTTMPLASGSVESSTQSHIPPQSHHQLQLLEFPVYKMLENNNVLKSTVSGHSTIHHIIFIILLILGP